MTRANLHRFAAMGCEIVVAGAALPARRAVERLFRERDLMFSRFIDDSELNRVNAAAGRPVRVSDEFARMVDVALDAAEESEGLVDPTVGAAITAAGYDVDFAFLPADGPAPRIPAPVCGRPIRLLGRLLLVDAGVKLDLNGVVKGATVDDALALVGERGWIAAGGDVGTRAGEVVVALPGGGKVRVERGAVATSGTDRRQWRRGGRRQHHLIDPRTGAPSDSPWQYVTASAATCLGADVAAKVGFLRGTSGPGWLDERGIAARFVTRTGREVVNEAWRRSLDPVLACT